MKLGQSINMQNISKFYGEFQALKEVNLSAEPGEFLTILGSSGSGKTSLLKVIAGFEEANQGQILMNGRDMVNQKAYERNIGMLFQNYALFPHLTIADNIAYPLKLRKYTKNDIKKAVSDMISLVKLDGMEKRYPKQLSGGQQQRVALARALVYNPPLLLLDEPLGALDKNLRHEMQFEIKRIQKELGITTISVTHDQEEALTMSDKICIMSHGVIQQVSSPNEIYAKPQNEFVASFMGNTNLIDGELIEKEEKDGFVYSKIKTAYSEKPFEIKEEKGPKTGYRLKNVMIAVRPEMLHLQRDDKARPNIFSVKNVDSIYLGDSVNMKLITVNGKEIAAKFAPELFNKYGNKKDLDLYFNPDGAVIIYETEFGKTIKQ